MEELLIKLKDLSAKLDKKEKELSYLIINYNYKRHDLYRKRNNGENVDEDLINNLINKEEELNKYNNTLGIKWNDIEKSIDDLEKYINELYLEDFHTDLDS